MESIELESKVKELIKISISNFENETIFREFNSKFEGINAYLTDIMSLGYNDNSIMNATEDIYEIQSQMPWIKVKKSDILKRVEISSILFKKEIKAFSLFHKGILLKKNPNEVLIEIQIILEDKI